VDFLYSDEVSLEKDPAKFWKGLAKKRNGQVEDFVNKKKAMEQAVQQTVGAGDSPEAKLQKVYARVQQLRNTDLRTGKNRAGGEAREGKRSEQRGRCVEEGLRFGRATNLAISGDGAGRGL